MAATKFTVITKNRETGNVIAYEMVSEMTYKTAVAIAKEVAIKEETDLIAVIESKKMFPNGEYESLIKLGEAAWRI